MHTLDVSEVKKAQLEQEKDIYILYASNFEAYSSSSSLFLLVRAFKA